MTNLEIVNLVQRSTAIVAFALLALQIYLKTNRKVLGFVTYFFVFIQPVLILLSMYIYSSRFDPFYMYTDLCVLCGGKYEYYINFLRIAFYTVSIAFISPYFKSINNWFKTNWKLLTNFYYLGFYSLSIYLYNTGPVTKSRLFTIFFLLCQVVVLANIYKKVKQLFH